MSPTVFKSGAYRFYFSSNEESRMHVHVQGPEGEAKFWLEPRIELARNFGMSDRAVTMLLSLIRDSRNEIVRAWQNHFGH